MNSPTIDAMKLTPEEEILFYGCVWCKKIGCRDIKHMWPPEWGSPDNPIPMESRVIDARDQ